MNYTVLWRPLAEQQLAQLWMSAADRNEVALAANAIDALLRRDPQSRGESRSGSTRILFVPPLTALFVVNEPDRIVYVTALGRSRRQS
jgi:hypothetical protein